MEVKDLKPNPKNPRSITPAKLEMLKKSLNEFGDLSGIVFNRKSKNLIGGHQRVKLISKTAKVTIEKKYSKPTLTGTLAEGFIEVRGERYRYREVSWEPLKEKAATLAANKAAGDWDLLELSGWLKELDQFGFNLDFTMFDKDELLNFMLPDGDKNFGPGDESDQGKLDEKKQVICPECQHKFTPK